MSCLRCIRSTIDWCDKHAGLGGWVGAVGAVIAVFVAWAISRAEYQRGIEVQHERTNAEISLLGKTVSDFDKIVHTYLDSGTSEDSTARAYYYENLNDPRVARMVDFNTMPITGWPSIASYDTFKTYFLTSLKIVQIAPADLKKLGPQQLSVYEEQFDQLQKALKAAYQ